MNDRERPPRLPAELRAGAHGRHRRSGHVGHRPHPAGPRRAGVGLGCQGVARGGARCAPAARRSGSATTRRRSTCCPAARPRWSRTHAAIPKTNPELVEAQAPRHPGDPATRGAGQADGRLHHADGDRHPRQDDDHVDAHRGAAAQRIRPVVRRRRRSRRGGHQRPPRQRRLFRRRGRRERRLAARVHPERRGGHQHRGRSPGLLRQRRGLQPRCSTQFVERLAPGGALVVCTDDPGAAALAERTAALGIGCCATAATTAATTWPRTLLSWEQQGTGAVAHIQLAGEKHPRVMRLSVPGRHMALNALARAAGGDGGRRAGRVGARRAGRVRGGAPPFRARSAPRHGVRVFDDYAHHPTEVRATLGAVRTVAEQSGRGRSVVVFQPHLYSRTEAFAREFGAGAGLRRRGVRARRVRRAGTADGRASAGASVAEHVSEPVHYVPDFSAVAEQVANAVRTGDVVITMGAGDVTMLGPEIVEALAAQGQPLDAATRAGDGCAMTRAGGRQRGDGRTRRAMPPTRRRAAEADEPGDRRGRRATQPRSDPKTTSRVRGGEHGGNARRAARPRPAPSRSSRPEGKPSGVRRVSPTDEAKPVARGRVRGLKLVVWTVLLVALFVGTRSAAVLHPDHGGAKHRRSPGSAR